MAAALAGALVVAGCLGLDGCAKPVPPPNYTLNRDPQERYEITLVADRPLPDQIEARAQYGIRNKACIPLDYTKGGSKTGHDVLKNYRIDRESRKKVHTTFIFDLIVPKDYWGLGLCRWHAIAVAFLFPVAGDSVNIGTYFDKQSDGAYDAIRGEGKAIWTCKNVSLNLQKQICRLLLVTDKYGNVVMRGIQQSKDTGLTVLAISSRRVNHDN